jgi:hypothetical protein
LQLRDAFSVRLLPLPGAITVHLWLASTAQVSAMGLHFNMYLHVLDQHNDTDMADWRGVGISPRDPQRSAFLVDTRVWICKEVSRATEPAPLERPMYQLKRLPIVPSVFVLDTYSKVVPTKEVPGSLLRTLVVTVSAKQQHYRRSRNTIGWLFLVSMTVHCQITDSILVAS